MSKRNKSCFTTYRDMLCFEQIVSSQLGYYLSKIGYSRKLDLFVGAKTPCFIIINPEEPNFKPIYANVD